LNHYDSSTGWHPYLIVAAFGAFIIVCGVVFQILQLIVSIKNREQYKDMTGDPWDGRTLEWSTSSPAPFYNFALTHEVAEIDAFWKTKQQRLNGAAIKQPHYQDIHMPKNTSVGLIIALLSGAAGFAIIWHMTWLMIAGLIGIIITIIIRTF